MTNTPTTINRLGIEVGDIFVSSWGFDQTNVDAYQTVRVSAASIWVVSIPTEIVGNRVRPVRQHESRLANLTPTLRRPRSTYQDQPAFNVNTIATAYLWDGQSTFHETYASGGYGR